MESLKEARTVDDPESKTILHQNSESVSAFLRKDNIQAVAHSLRARYGKKQPEKWSSDVPTGSSEGPCQAAKTGNLPQITSKEVSEKLTNPRDPDKDQYLGTAEPSIGIVVEDGPRAIGKVKENQEPIQDGNPVVNNSTPSKDSNCKMVPLLDEGVEFFYARPKVSKGYKSSKDEPAKRVYSNIPSKRHTEVLAPMHSGPAVLKPSYASIVKDFASRNLQSNISISQLPTQITKANQPGQLVKRDDHGAEPTKSMKDSRGKSRHKDQTNQVEKYARAQIAQIKKATLSDLIEFEEQGSEPVREGDANKGELTNSKWNANGVPAEESKSSKFTNESLQHPSPALHTLEIPESHDNVDVEVSQVTRKQGDKGADTLSKESLKKRRTLTVSSSSQETPIFEIFEKSSQTARSEDGHREANTAAPKGDTALAAPHFQEASQNRHPRHFGYGKQGKDMVERIRKAAHRMADKELKMKTKASPLREATKYESPIMLNSQTLDQSPKLTKQTLEELDIVQPEDHVEASRWIGRGESLANASKISVNTRVHGAGPVRGQLLVGPHMSNEFNPLNDIKGWSEMYFRIHFPELAEEAAQFEIDHEFDRASSISQADTRSLSGASELGNPKDETDGPISDDWLKFTGQFGETPEHLKLSDIPIRMQLSVWDADFSVPGKGLFENACWSVGHEAAKNIDRWISMNVDIKTWHKIDINDILYLSGQSRPSGLLEKCLVQPPDAMFSPSPPDFDPIRWEKIRVLPAKNSDSLSPFKRVQTSDLCSQIMRTPYKEKVALIEMQREEMQDQMKQLTDEVSKVRETVDLNKARRKDNYWVPRLNFYVRPARQCDISQIQAIYKEWVEATCCTKDLSPRDASYFEDRLANRQDMGLPFLVAAAKSSRGIRDASHNALANSRRGSRYRANMRTQERIVGFTYADPYGSLRGDVFRGVVELKLFVDRRFLHQGVGKTLMDRAMTFLDPLYQCHRGTDYEYSDQLDGITYKLGPYAPASKIRKVLLEVFYQGSNAREFAWKREMLEEKFEFHQTGFYLNLGEKDSVPIHLATFLRESCNVAGPNSMIYPGQPKAIPGIIRPILDDSFAYAKK